MKRESKVHTDKLEALEDCTQNGGEFFSSELVESDPVKPPKRQTVYIVAISEHQATLALSRYAMPLTKWTKGKQNDEYIDALRNKVSKLTEDKEPETQDAAAIDSEVS